MVGESAVAAGLRTCRNACPAGSETCRHGEPGYNTRMPDPGLESAYLATDYRVDAGPDGPFALRVGERCPDVDRLLARHGQSEWAFVTACNPESEQLTHPENER